jgi:hypothetical protein
LKDGNAIVIAVVNKDPREAQTLYLIGETPSRVPVETLMGVPGRTPTAMWAMRESFRKSRS